MKTELRLENGQRAFEDVRKDIAAIAEIVKPKTLPIWQIIGVTIATLSTLLGAWLSMRSEVEGKAERGDIIGVQREQAEQRVMIQGFKEDMKEIKADVKAIRRKGD